MISDSFKSRNVGSNFTLRLETSFDHKGVDEHTVYSAFQNTKKRSLPPPPCLHTFFSCYTGMSFRNNSRADRYFDQDSPSAPGVSGSDRLYSSAPREFRYPSDHEEMACYCVRSPVRHYRPGPYSEVDQARGAHLSPRARRSVAEIYSSAPARHRYEYREDFIGVMSSTKRWTSGRTIGPILVDLGFHKMTHLEQATTTKTLSNLLSQRRDLLLYQVFKPKLITRHSLMKFQRKPNHPSFFGSFLL